MPHRVVAFANDCEENVEIVDEIIKKEKKMQFE